MMSFYGTISLIVVLLVLVMFFQIWSVQRNEAKFGRVINHVTNWMKIQEQINSCIADATAEIEKDLARNGIKGDQPTNVSPEEA